MEIMNTIDFKVPLSGSKLFDTHTLVMAKKLCDKFPGLHYNMEQDHIHIFGELNEYWTNEWNKAVFQLGEIDN